MKFSAVVLAFAAAVSAQSVDPAQATLSLFGALPSTLAALALTNPSAAATAIASEFVTGTPTWFTVLPTEVQSYFITQVNPVSSGATTSIGALATAASSLVANVTGAINSNASSIRSSASSKISSLSASVSRASTSAAGAASGSASASATSGSGAVPTAVSFGIAGAAGLAAAILAL